MSKVLTKFLNSALFYSEKFFNSYFVLKLNNFLKFSCGISQNFIFLAPDGARLLLQQFETL